MSLKNLLAKTYIKNFLWMLLFGVISFFFGMIKFYIPGIEGAISDLREIPLLVSNFYISNPLFSIGISALSALDTPPDGSYLSTFLMHSIALVISWFFVNYLKKQNLSILFQGTICFAYIFVYYLVLLLPLLIYTNHLVNLNLDKPFIRFYFDLIKVLRYEIISSAFITSLYFVLLNLRIALNKHLNNLEEIVKERTSELNATVEKLKTTQQYLIQKEKMASLGTLSAGIAHEINNPLNFISGGMQLIAKIKNEIPPNDSEGIRERLDTANTIINEGLLRASGIISALNTFSIRGKSKLVNSDLHKIITNTLLFLNYKIPEGLKIKKDFQLKNKIPLFEDKIHQVIINIIDNALFEFNSESNVEGEITIATSQNNEYAILTISNTGKQIPEQLLNHIFDPFFTTKEPGQGVGLGLSIAYTLINEHNGKISVINSDYGVSFIIEIPLKG